MKYVPNLIPEDYRVSLDELQINKKEKNIFGGWGILIIMLLGAIALCAIIYKVKQQRTENHLNSANPIDSTKESSRKDSLNMHQKAAELAVQKFKWKAASFQYNKALEFASSIDSQYIIQQIAVCKNKNHTSLKKPRSINGNTKNENAKAPIQVRSVEN